jgi:cell division protease FtsH
VQLGAERKSLVMNEDERKQTAYHEAGHAVCAIRVTGTDPLHKVTIVPRGRTLGVAFTVAEDDRVSISRQQLDARLVMAYGGRVAEELVFGRDRVTIGAASDIQMATSLARRYVSQWGLSDKIGPILVGDNEQELFLGAQIMTRREVSERTAQLVDEEVARVVRESYERARVVITENRPLLDTLANALLDRETLTREDIKMLVDGEQLPPRLPPGEPSALPTAVSAPANVEAKVAPPLLGGPEIQPA